MSMYNDNAKSRAYEDIVYMIDSGDINFYDLLDIVKDIYKNEIEEV